MKFPFLRGESKPKENDDVYDHNSGETPDAEEVLRQHDRESRFRKLTGFWLFYVVAISVIFIAYHVLTARFGTPIILKHRIFHLGLILMLAWAYFPAMKNSRKDRPSIIDIGLILATLATAGYGIYNVEPFLIRGGIALPTDYIMGAVMILLVLEACRRVVGKGLLILAIIFLLYVYFGQQMPGVFNHRGYSLERIIYHMYLGTEGIFGIPIGVSASYLVIFIALGAMLDKSGLGKLFNDVALSIGGRMTGGPAKVSVIASALMGTISGSAATNVATTGAFTIPLMKRVGYKPHFAGSIEAAASTGGQIMPPIMGSAAFIMAEFLGVPYLTIAAAAIIPALLYFLGVFFQIDLRARRRGLRGLSKDEMPDTMSTVKRYGHMFIPIIILLYFLMDGFSPIYAAFYALVSAWLLALIRKETRLGPRELVDMCVNAARSTISVAVAMGTAGFIVAVMGMTGLGVILADNIVLLANGITFIALLLVMVVSIILGMGLPTSACYVIAASIAVPILTRMEVPAFQAHFFVMYYAVVSTITPPVALSSYVAAGMAGADPTKVGWTAFRLAIAAFIIPFFFIYSPAMLLIADNGYQIFLAVLTGIAGTFALATAAEGYLMMDLPAWNRLMFFGAALALINPGIASDLIGIALFAIPLVYIFNKRKNNGSIAGVSG